MKLFELLGQCRICSSLRDDNDYRGDAAYSRSSLLIFRASERSCSPGPTSLMTASTISSTKRQRFSMLPPYSSVRSLVLFFRNSSSRYPAGL